MNNPFAMGAGMPTTVADYGLPQAPAMVPAVNPTPAAPLPAAHSTKLGFWDKLDAIFGGDIGNALDAVRRRKEAAAQHEQLLAAINSLPPEERTIALANPTKWAEEKAKDLSGYTLSPGQERVGPDGKVTHRTAAKPTPLNTSRGIYEYDPETRTTSPLETFDPPAPKAPAGYKFGDDGVLHFIEGGPADPRVILGNAKGRRRVVVDNPLPSRAKPSQTVVAPPAPWTRKW